MRAGGLRHCIVIEQPVNDGAHDYGGQIIRWDAFLSTRARNISRSGREFERARQTVADVHSVFVIRYNPTLAPLSKLQSMRVKNLHDGSIHNILYADDPSDLRRQINIYTSEGQSGENQ